jgi:hypothetical protein
MSSLFVGQRSSLSSVDKEVSRSVYDVTDGPDDHISGGSRGSVVISWLTPNAMKCEHIEIFASVLLRFCRTV